MPAMLYGNLKMFKQENSASHTDHNWTRKSPFLQDRVVDFTSANACIECAAPTAGAE